MFLPIANFLTPHIYLSNLVIQFYEWTKNRINKVNSMPEPVIDII